MPMRPWPLKKTLIRGAKHSERIIGIRSIVLVQRVNDAGIGKLMTAEELEAGALFPPGRTLEAEQARFIHPPATIGHFHLIADAGRGAVIVREADPEGTILVRHLDLVSGDLQHREDQMRFGGNRRPGELHLGAGIGLGGDFGGRVIKGAAAQGDEGEGGQQPETAVSKSKSGEKGHQVILGRR